MRSDLKDNSNTFSKMIQFGTVKYGIVKQLKDRTRTERDTTSEDEDRSTILCSPVAECKSSSPELQQNMVETESDGDHNHNNHVSEDREDRFNKSPIKTNSIDTTYLETNHKTISPVEQLECVIETNDEQDKDFNMSEDDERENDQPKLNLSNENDHIKNDERLINDNGSPIPALPQFPTPPMTLETIQNMQIAIAQFAAKTLASGGADNEAAMKQLAFMQQTLFNLQQQQIFQLQLIQQLQSQLAMNQMKCDDDQENLEDDDVDDDDDDDDDNEEQQQKLCSENLTNHKTIDNQKNNRENMDTISPDSDENYPNNKDDEDHHQNDYTNHLNHLNHLNHKHSQEKDNQHQHQIDKICDNHQQTVQKELTSLASLPRQDENTPLPYGTDLASSIITNHDHPPSLDEPNSLEMLQKRAQEVLDSASQGILAGNLADEFAFGKDKNGDGKNRNEPFFKHRCRYCGKVFGSDSALQIHIRSHTGERPFKCNVCGSRFTTKGNLKVHFQRHAQKFPHIPMNSTPIPEHLDKFHPPLLEQMSPETSPQHQPQMPHSNIPVSLPLPFPPGGGFPGLPPLYRPPLDILKSLGPYSNPFFSALPPLQVKRDQELPTDLRKPPSANSPKIKEETKHESISLRIKEENDNDNIETVRPRSTTPPPLPPPSSSIQLPLSIPISSQPTIPQHPIQMPQLPPTSTPLPSSISREELHERLPLNFVKTSPERRSPNRSPASMPRSPFLGPLKPEMSLLPRPHSNDNSWENFIEVSNTSETMKLKELMKNKKLTDPNQCVVCDRVLSCKSALQMHYRTHTGERPFKCRICGRAFTTKGNLKTHMAVHKIRPPMRNFHQCPVCHKKYSNALVLQQHIRLHTGEPTDLTPEQIQAAEIRDFPPSMVHGSFLNPFAFNFSMSGHNGTIGGSESSQGDNDDVMDCGEEFEDEDISDHMSNSGDCDRPKSRDDIKGMYFDQRLKIENNRPKSETSNNSSAPTSPISAINKSSPVPSDLSQGALDLTPRTTLQQPPSNHNMLPTRPPFGMFPNLPLFPPVNSTPQNVCSAMNSIAQSVMPSAPFNPLALSGVRGSTTCGICFKTFPCHSALEIHYRSHTKERPFKCTICDRGFTTKGNLKQHMLTHKIRDMEQDAFRNRAIKYVGAEHR